jgi:hypothetical membrane protein
MGGFSRVRATSASKSSGEEDIKIKYHKKRYLTSLAPRPGPGLYVTLRAMSVNHAQNAQKLSIGAMFWVLNAQYFIVQIIVATAWSRHDYSWANNTISDLANTHCGFYGDRFVCSPLHAIMNVSFIMVGVTIISGAILLKQELASSITARLGFGCMALAGVGAILIGLFPENSISSLHIIGAALSFVLGNLGMLVLYASLKRLPRALRAYTLISGMVGLIALALFMGNIYLGLGIGGMERFVSYPQTIWMIVFGSYLLLSRRPAEFV